MTSITVTRVTSVRRPSKAVLRVLVALALAVAITAALLATMASHPKFAPQMGHPAHYGPAVKVVSDVHAAR